MPETALGIPDREMMSDPAKLKTNQLVDYILHKHDALRAKLHYDLRLGTPEAGLQSWAVPKGMPLKGEKRLAVLQPEHKHVYGVFEGSIPKGQYGAGEVSIADKGSVLITKSLPDELSFTIADKRYPESFKLLKTKDKQWLLLNTTPVNYKTLEENGKPKYTVIDPKQAETLMDGTNAVSAKLDGASSLIEVLGDKIEAVSYRPGKQGPISYAHKIGLTGIAPDPSLKGTVLRGEVMGFKGNKAIPPQELGGLLNSTISKSRATQQAKGINLKTAIFDVVKSPDTDDLDTYRKRLAAMQGILARLPQDKFMQAPVETDSQKALKLFRQIKAGKHPTTREGVVVTSLDQPGAIPAKAKFGQEYDVHIKDVFPAVTKGKPRAGGFSYSLEPGGPEVGKVGTGFSHNTLVDMLANPETYKGRIARVNAQEQFPSGALRAPVNKFIALHEDIGK